MDFKIFKKGTAAKKTSRAKNPVKVRVERTIGIVLVVLMGAAAIMLAARRPDAAASPEMTSKVVTPATDDQPVVKATSSHVDMKGSTAKHGTANAVIASPVTLTGCLEQDHDVFKLKDTEGADAPQSRSWKSGFLKKRPATITVMDASHRLKLDKHVGERVSVTGPLADREMTARSLTRVANSCE